MAIPGPELLADPTVLVLGAGASATYGFPLDSGLKEGMLNHLNSKTEVRMEKMGFSDDQGNSK